MNVDIDKIHPTHLEFESAVNEYQNAHVEIDVRLKFSRDGIGAYEFWGAKCFDSGHLGVDNFKVVGGFIDVADPSGDYRIVDIGKIEELLADEMYDDFNEKALETAEPDHD